MAVPDDLEEIELQPLGQGGEDPEVDNNDESPVLGRLAGCTISAASCAAQNSLLVPSGHKLADYLVLLHS